jgi:uncharacterized protein YndB with AHSA1/START domain
MVDHRVVGLGPRAAAPPPGGSVVGTERRPASGNGQRLGRRDRSWRRSDGSDLFDAPAIRFGRLGHPRHGSERVSHVSGAGTVGSMNEQVVSVSRVIDASPEAIFDVLTDPARHAEIDGSGMVQKLHGESNRLELGSTFGMDMKFGFIPYRMTNTVVEFEENRLIAWQHFNRHRWRYELAPVDGGTEVTESFDWSTARSPKSIELMGYPKKHPANMEATLERLAAVLEA